MLKTTGKQGEIAKRITVTSNDPEKGNLVLEIKGEIVVDVLVEPRNVGFRQLSKGVEATEMLTVKVAEPDRIKVAELGVDDPRFEIKMTSGELATESKWEIKFKGAKELGTLQAKIVIKYAADGEPKTLEIPIRGSVVGDLQYVRSIHFGKSPTTGFTEREVRLSSRSGKTVKIKKVEDPDGLLKIDIATPEGNPAVFKATVLSADGDYSKPTQHVLKVRTTDPDEPVVEISYMISLRDRGRNALPKNLSGDSPVPRLDGVVPRASGAPNVPQSAGSTAEQKPESKP